MESRITIYLLTPVFLFFREIINIPFLICLMIVCFPSHAQQLQSKYLVATIAPLNILDQVSSVLQIGIQQRVNRKFSVSASYGFRLNSFFSAREGYNRLDYHYSKSKLEFKYYTKISQHNRKTFNHNYISLQALYIPQRYRKEKSFIVRDYTYYRYDSSNIRNNVIVASFLLGIENIMGRFSFDKYVGIGIRKSKITHETNSSLVEERHKNFSYEPIDFREGHFKRIHISLGVKFGYIINQRVKKQ